MRKKLLVLALAGCMVLATGCGKDSDKGSNSGSPDSFPHSIRSGKATDSVRSDRHSADIPYMETARMMQAKTARRSYSHSGSHNCS